MKLEPSVISFMLLQLIGCKYYTLLANVHSIHLNIHTIIIVIIIIIITVYV